MTARNAESVAHEIVERWSSDGPNRTVTHHDRCRCGWEGKSNLLRLLEPMSEAHVGESLEDALIAARIRERIANDDGTRYTLTEVAEMLGIDLQLIDGTVPGAGPG